MPSTVNKGYTTPLYNTEIGTWGADIVSNFISVVDLNVGGFVSVPLSSTNVTLTTGSSGQIQNLIIGLTGTILTNIVVASAAVGFYFVENLTTGSFTVTLQANFGSGGVGTAWVLPQGSRTMFICDATMGARPASGDVYDSWRNAGTIRPFGGPTAPWGTVLAYGQVLSQTLYPYLYTAYGTAYNTGGEGTGNFRVPDLRGRSWFGLDNMGGSAAGRLLGLAGGNITNPTVLGSTGGEENHQIVVSEMPSHKHTDAGHTHPYAAFDFFSGPGGGLVGGTSGYLHDTSGTTSAGAANIQNTGGDGYHNTTPPAMVGNWIIKT
jgi:microcystin-dependent protein